jgi:tetratricopeptide (TPR) repeat protein
MDLAVAFSPPGLPDWRLSIVQQDLVAPSFRLVDREDSLPWTRRVGLSNRRPMGLGGVLELAVAMEQPELADRRLGIGAEFRFQGLYAARISAASGGFTAGLGGRWRDYALDYAWRSGGELGSSSFVTLSWYFGEGLESRRRREQERREAELAQARLEGVETWRRQEVARAQEELREALGAGDTETAAEGLARARALGVEAEEVTEAARRLERLEEEQTQEVVRTEVRRIRIEEAEARLRSALESSDPVEARQALQALERLAPDHPMHDRFVQQTEQMVAGAVAGLAQEASRAEETGSWTEALDAWARVARLDPEHPGVLAAQQRWQRELAAARDRSRQAEEEAEAARLELAAEQTYSLVLERYAQGDLAEAERLARTLLARQPGHRGARQVLERVQAASAAPPPLGPEEEDRVRELYLSGLARFTEEDYRGAVESWKRILAIDPGNRGALNNIAEAEARLRRLQAAPTREGVQGDR